MYELTKDDIYADIITDAYEDYENEYEVKILVELDPELQIEKYNQEFDYEDNIYLLVTMEKKYQTITYISTEYEDGKGDIHFISSNYSPKERELIKDYAVKKWREKFTTPI